MKVNILEEIKQNLMKDIQKREEERIIEPSNAELLKRLIQRAENESEAYAIAALGTTYKRTGFHFDKRLEELSQSIAYLKKDEKLSFDSYNGGGGYIS